MLAAARAEIDQIIGCANDLFLMFDHQQRISFVAQVVHYPHQLADIARVQPDARLVHDKQSVHQRRTKACREIHPLDFAAAQRARRTIESEITDADLAEIIQARANFVTQHLGGFVDRRDMGVAKKVARIGNRQRLKFRQR